MNRVIKRSLGLIIVGVVAVGCSAGAAGLSSSPPQAANESTPKPVSTPQPTPVPTATPDPTPVPTPDPTPVPTPVPAPQATPKPAPVKYAALTSRTWKQIVKSPDKYTGKAYQLWGCIHQFDAATGDSNFLANASNKRQTYWNLYGENAWFTGSASRLSPFVEGDIVLMNVVVHGSYSYDTQAGGNTTVPSFDIAKIARKGSCG